MFLCVAGPFMEHRSKIRHARWYVLVSIPPNLAALPQTATSTGGTIGFRMANKKQKKKYGVEVRA